MREYDVFLPLTNNEGRLIAEDTLTACKKMLLDEFGGFTHFPQKNEGAWKLGGVVFHDQVVILRVLSEPSESTRRLFAELRLELMRRLEQADILIVAREVELVS